MRSEEGRQGRSSAWPGAQGVQGMQSWVSGERNCAGVQAMSSTSMAMSSAAAGLAEKLARAAGADRKSTPDATAETTRGGRQTRSEAKEQGTSSTTSGGVQLRQAWQPSSASEW